MKKILLCALLSFVIFSVWKNVYASDTTMSNAIFKIQAYSYDKLSETYVYEQYGSAVLIAKNILLTNAHVITDDNNELTLQYEACQTISDQEPPKCFSTLQLLKYDTDTDLALLQIVTPTSTMPTPVVMGSGDLSVGTNVRVVGYPANGGATITTTQGSIAGFENGFYKTDANVDGGNSGGGTFDGAGEFIGIPTYVVNGQTTLGYIIPTKTIKEFIGGGGTSYKQKYSAGFDKRIKSFYTIEAQGMIDNALLTTPYFTGAGLVLDTSIEKKNNHLYKYSLYTKNDNSVDIVSLIATDNATINKYINNVMIQFRDDDYSPKKTTKKIGNTSWSVISFGSDDRVGYDYIQTSSSNKTYLEFMVVVYKSHIEELPALIEFVENITIKKLVTKPQVFNLPLIKLSSQWNIGITKWMKTAGFAIGIFPNNGKYVAEIGAYMGGRSDTLKTVTNNLRDNIDDKGWTATAETSKYPSSASITSVTDANDKASLRIVGIKKYGGGNMFVFITIEFNSNSAKQEAISLGYKILGLE